MQEWYLGRQKVSLLERCPQFRGDLIEGFHCKLDVHSERYSPGPLHGSIMHVVPWTSRLTGLELVFATATHLSAASVQDVQEMQKP